MNAHLLLRPNLVGEETRVVSAAVARRGDEVSDVDQTLRSDLKAVAGEHVHEARPGKQLSTCRGDPRIEIPLTGAGRRGPDEQAHLLEHLSDSGDGVRGIPAAVLRVERAAWKDEGTRCERAAIRAAEHAHFHAITAVTQQCDRAGRDRGSAGSVRHRCASYGETHKPRECTHEGRDDGDTMWLDMKSHLDVALELADVADAITLQRFRAPDLRVDTKSDNTPVTDADQATEQALRDALQRLRPNQEIVGEEYGGDSSAEWRWMLDPIDGTINYAHGVPVWATLIALMRGERAVCGVVSAAALGRRWWAATGHGAFTDSGQRLHVSPTAAMEDAYVSCTDIRDFTTRRGDAGWRQVLERARVMRAFGDFWSHMLVAEGVIDIAIEAWVNPWDVAATQVIITEAGGRFSDFDGADRIDSGTVISTNGVLHDAVVALMRESGNS